VEAEPPLSRAIRIGSRSQGSGNRRAFNGLPTGTDGFRGSARVLLHGVPDVEGVMNHGDDRESRPPMTQEIQPKTSPASHTPVKKPERSAKYDPLPAPHKVPRPKR
jgi:hypothetical protein